MIALKQKVDQVSEDFKRTSRKSRAAWDAYAAWVQARYETEHALIDAQASARAAKSAADMALSKLRDGLQRFRAAQDRRAEIERVRPMTTEEKSQLDAAIARVGLAGLKGAYDSAVANASDAASKAELASANYANTKRSMRSADAAFEKAVEESTAAERALEDVRITLANIRDCPPPAPPASSAPNAPAAPDPCPPGGGFSGTLNNEACRLSRQGR